MRSTSSLDCPRFDRYHIVFVVVVAVAGKEHQAMVWGIVRGKGAGSVVFGVGCLCVGSSRGPFFWLCCGAALFILRAAVEDGSRAAGGVFVAARDASQSVSAALVC